MSATPERSTPHARAWSKDARRSDMRNIIALFVKTAHDEGVDVAKALDGLSSAHVAATFGGGILPCEVDAEKMKHLSESEGK